MRLKKIFFLNTNKLRVIYGLPGKRKMVDYEKDVPTTIYHLLGLSIRFFILFYLKVTFTIFELAFVCEESLPEICQVN